MFARFKPDTEAYRRRIQDGPCFICQIISGRPEYPHHIVYEDSSAIAFLDRYPTLYGHTLVAPRRHQEQVTADFSRHEYLELQSRIYDIAEAVRAEVQAERVYVLSLGSQQGNAHVHWHIAPLPRGVPFDKQQLQALDWQNGILNLPPREMALLAARIRLRLLTQNTAAYSWHLDVAG